MRRLFLSCLMAMACFQFSWAQVQTLNQKDTGYRGIWYSNQPSNDEYVFKYSGGLGTYPANHYPFSVYVKAVNKTFFAMEEQIKQVRRCCTWFLISTIKPEWCPSQPS